MKAIIKTFIASYLAFYAIFGVFHHFDRQRDSYTRQRVLKLVSSGASCSAVQVIAPSGKVYVLTAGHCIDLLTYGNVLSIDEEDNKFVLKFIQEDFNSDLLLLEAPNDKGVEIATVLGKHERVHTMTHGAGYPSYRTDGEVVTNRIVVFPWKQLLSPEDLQTCTKVKNVINLQDNLCLVGGFDTVSTAFIIPGSSGGPLFNDQGDLVGIASATDGGPFSAFVSLKDIQAFMAGR